MDNKIRKFIAELKLRLNLRLVVAESGPALFVCGLTATCIALGFVLSGHRVELPWLLAAPVAGLAAFLLKVSLQLYSKRNAAAVGDKVFGLKDALVSFLDFEDVSASNPFHELRIERTARLCTQLKTGSLALFIPWRLYLAAVLCLLISGWLCTFDDAPQVAAKKALEKATLAKTTELGKKLADELEKLKVQLDGKEAKALEKSKLEKLIKDLRQTPDPREALRQYSKAEAELQKLLDKDSVRNDDKLLADVGSKLKEDASSKALGEKLSSGDYKDAASKLSKMASEKHKKLDDRKNKATKLKRMADKMKGEAAKRSDMKSALKESMKELAKSAEKLQGEAEKAEGEEAKGELSEAELEQLEKSEEESDGKLLLLEQELKDHDAKKAFLAKAKNLSDALRSAEQSIGMGETDNSKENGPGIGTASAGNFDNKDKSKQFKSFDTALKGQKNKSGESFTKIEEASSGTGVATAGEKAAAAEFKRQYESFIRREDVPEGMKGAVKLYFNSLHNKQE